jgi:hypothetical protein
MIALVTLSPLKDLASVVRQAHSGAEFGQGAGFIQSGAFIVRGGSGIAVHTGFGRQVTATRLARQFGRQAFGENPARYHSSRPEYPEWVYATLASGCGLRRRAVVFEIGTGTGTATRRLLDLGADPLTAVEPDQRLAGLPAHE